MTTETIAVSLSHPVVVDGQSWLELSPHVQAAADGCCLTIRAKRQPSDPDVLMLGEILWPDPAQPQPDGVTFQRPEYPQTFWIRSGERYVHFSGSCFVGGGAYSLLQAKFAELQTEAEITLTWTNTVDAPLPPLDAFRAKYPMLLNWPDRRPIGLSYANSHLDGANKWYFPWSTQAEFETAMHAHYDTCIVNCLSIDAQGLIDWSIEGQPFPHPTSYIGDPMRYGDFCHETTPALIHALFAKVVAAGLKPGVTIRPQELKQVAGVWQQFDQDDCGYVAAIRRKMRWAYDHLGCRLFYLDTCWRIQGGHPLLPPFARLRDVFAEFPDCLVIPEQSTPAWLTVASAFSSGISGVSADMRHVWPECFGVMFMAHGGVDWSLPENLELLEASMAAGNVATANVGYESPDLVAIKSVLEP